MQVTELFPKDFVPTIVNTVACDKECMFCGVTHTVLVSVEDYTAWKLGKFIQDAFPYLTTDQRELLQTGSHAKCWEQAFPPEDDTEDASPSWANDAKS